MLFDCPNQSRPSFLDARCIIAHKVLFDQHGLHLSSAATWVEGFDISLKQDFSLSPLATCPLPTSSANIKKLNALVDGYIAISAGVFCSNHDTLKLTPLL